MANTNLLQTYGNDTVSKRGPIPAHLLGNMWAQTWDVLAPSLYPYPNKRTIDVSTAMKDQVRTHTDDKNGFLDTNFNIRQI